MRLSSSSQFPQQSINGALIGIVILPLGNVPDMLLQQHSMSQKLEALLWEIFA
jgi:hypothetical protein